VEADLRSKVVKNRGVLKTASS